MRSEQPPRNNNGWRQEADGIRNELYKRNRRPLLERLGLKRKKRTGIAESESQMSKIININDFRK